MKFKTTMTALAVTLSLVATSQAIAKGGHGGKDRSGAYLENKFNRMDTDESATLTLEEFTANVATKTEKKFNRVDTDASGDVSLDEFLAAGRQSEDLTDYADEIVQCVQDIKDATEGSLIMVPDASKFSSKEDKFNDLDTSGDGALQLEEMVDAKMTKATNAFNTMDANADGEVTLEEFTAHAEAKKETRQAIRTCVSDVLATED